MSKDTARSAVNPEENIITSPLDEIVRKGARKMLMQALETEVDSFLEKYQYMLDDNGNRLVVHKTVNVLDKLPESMRGRAKSMLHDIYLAPSKKDANIAFDRFIEEFGLKYPKATECLAKDRDDLLAFYDYPAERWPHIRTTNPIESTFATVRLRTHKTKGCSSRIATLTMVFKLLLSAQESWKKLRGYEKIIDVMNGVQFKDGVEVVEKQLEAITS